MSEGDSAAKEEGEEEEEEEEEEEGEEDEEEEEDGGNERASTVPVPVVAMTTKRRGPTPGVVYLSRVPPFMQPGLVRHHLSALGEVARLYLQPEDALVRRRRKRYGGNSKRSYSEGWVEFRDRRCARRAALALNSQPVGGKKRSYYHDDLWNIKYLPKFRWTHLAEKSAYERAVRDQRLRTETAQAKRENAYYLQNVEKGMEISAIVERKRKRGTARELCGESRRVFKQRRLAGARKAEKEEEEEEAGSVAGRKLSDSLLKKILPV